MVTQTATPQSVLDPRGWPHQYRDGLDQLANALQKEMWQHIQIAPNIKGKCLEIVGDAVFARIRVYGDAEQYAWVEIRSRLHRNTRFDDLFHQAFKGLEVHITPFEPYFR